MRRNYVGSVIWTVELNGKRWKEIKNSIRIYAGLFITEKSTEKSTERTTEKTAEKTTEKTIRN